MLLTVSCGGSAAPKDHATPHNASTSSTPTAGASSPAPTRAASSDAGSTARAPDAGHGAGVRSDAGPSLDAAQAPDAAHPASDAGGAAQACPGAKPDATNTGVPATTKLTVVSQDITVSQDNTTIEAQDIHGFLTIKASHVKVLRSIVRGHATSATTAIIRIDSGTDILIEDTEVAAAEPSVDVDGVSGGSFTARRLNIHGGVDGMKLGTGARVECSYIHDLASFASDPNQSGGATHNDAIQILAGTDIQIIGNQLVAAKDQNSAIQITQDFGKVGNVHIEHNWADGGGCTFNISHKGAASLTDIFTTGNRFGRNSFYDCPILESTKTTLTSTGDVWDDNDMQVPIQTHD
ncbi:MAG: hypothetical protein ACHQ53_06880 [Polyangiales bacterium]